MRFSVRGLIIFVILIGVGLAWMVRNACLQREAVVTIGHTSGIAIYDWNWRNEKYVDGGQAWAPKWLVDLIGVDYFGHVAGVAFRSDARVTDEVMALSAPEQARGAQRQSDYDFGYCTRAPERSDTPVEHQH